MRKLGAYSRRCVLSVIDGRRAEAKLMRDVRAELTKHCGGSPSATQRMLIDQVAVLRLRLHLMDRRFADTGAQTDHDSRCYLAWSNSLTRTLSQLGLQPPSERPPTPAEALAAACSPRMVA